ncbi:Zinc regulated protein [Maudiozyma exigua]|uniref:Zinc regulated protein n=1 Tax=Maudiozyma exigua TaxID=34358 RepID=A0A9P6WBL6_MAUEX|nr:Zinc regulated protein [Kazachstania exigua]
MRSFIKSHRKSGSLERNKPNKVETYPNNGTASSTYNSTALQSFGDIIHSTRGSFERRNSNDIISKASNKNNDTETSDFIPTTPHRSNNSQERGSPSIPSPNFESFHKLASKTKLTSKLFNKNSSSHPSSMGFQSQDLAPITSISTSASSSPTRKPKSSFEVLPTIHGTITHSWGDHHNSSPIINLNNQSNNELDLDNENNRRFSTDSWEPRFITSPRKKSFERNSNDVTTLTGTIKTSNINNIELDPAFKIVRPLNLPKIRESSSSSSGFGIPKSEENKDLDRNIILKANKNHSVDTLQSTDSERHNTISRNKIKNKNRKITIHSSGDLLALQNVSEVPDISIINSTTVPKFKIQESSPRKLPIDNNSDNEGDEGLEDSSQINKNPNHLSFESDSGSDSDESKFSFEYSNINGRTSSVKYYKKPDENECDNSSNDEPSIYVDDLYEEEELDDDVNYMDDSYVNNDDNAINYQDIVDITVDKEIKKVNKYNDLFDLSDDVCDVDVKIGENNKEIEEHMYVGTSPATNSTNLDENKTVSYPVTCDAPKKSQKKISKYNDLFDLSDDDMESTDSPITEDNKNEDIVCRPTQTVTNPKQISRYNDIFDISDDDDNNADEDYSDFSDSPIQYFKEDELKEGNDYLSKDSLQPGRSKLSVAPIDFLSLNNHLPVLNENAQSVEFMSPGVNDTFSSFSPGSSHIPKILLSPAGSDTKTDFSVDIKTPREHLLKLSPLPYTPNEESHSHTNLPPPARSQSLKYHDLNSNLDSEIPGLTSNLFFIDEAEEDEYNNELKKVESNKSTGPLKDDEEIYNDYLDEINTVPEDFEFSDGDEYHMDSFSGKNTVKGLSFPPRRSPLANRDTFRKTHSYNSKPLGVSREKTPMKNKLQLDNKTVTFFNSSWDDQNSISEVSRESSLKRHNSVKSPNKPLEVANEDVVSTTFFALSPSYGRTNSYSLSPIQESAANHSAPGSPKVTHQD